jgi:glycosyltransferase involved in cell wall biosynthesis
MRIALVADTDAATAGQQGGLACALRDAGQQATEHVMDTGRGGAADVGAVMPGFADTLRSQWSRERPDVVHARGWACGLAALAAAKDAGLPVVTAFAGLAVTERRHGLPPQLERARLERAIAASSRAVIAASSEEAGDLVRMGVSRRRVHMIPAGVDVSVFTPDEPASSQAGRAEKAKPRIVTAPDCDDEQAATLARALAAVPGAELIACPASAARGADLAALLRSADLFVHTPAYDALGIGCLQAMACGLLVVASAVGAHTDMVVDGTTGMLVPPGRPELLAARIRHLLDNAMLRQACGVAAVDRARSRYTWDRVAAETLAVCEAAAQAQLAAA